MDVLLFQRGVLLDETGRTTEADAVLTEALALDPAHTKALNSRGLVRMRLGRLCSAKADLDEAVRLAPEWELPYINRAQVDVMLGNLKAAQDDCTVAIDRLTALGTSKSNCGPRLGQGAFRVAVTDAYERECAVTHEHSLPVLEAAHIVPYAQGGVHEVSNGLLLRSYLHRLFDLGYVTVTPELRVEVSGRLRGEFENGRTYYPMQGTQVKVPSDPRLHPDANLLRWHKETAFRA